MSTSVNYSQYGSPADMYAIGENDTKNQGKAAKSGKTPLEQFAHDVTRAKAKTAQMVYEAVASSNDPNLINQLNSNKAYQFLSDPSNHSVKDHDIADDDMANMFQLMFKALDSNKESASMSAQSSALKLLTDMKMTEKVSQGTEDGVTKMQADIKAADDAKDSGNFWSIFTMVAIIVVVVVVTVAVTVATGGAAAPEAAVGDAALLGDGGVAGGVAGASEGAAGGGAAGGAGAAGDGAGAGGAGAAGDGAGAGGAGAAGDGAGAGGAGAASEGAGGAGEGTAATETTEEQSSWTKLKDAVSRLVNMVKSNPYGRLAINAVKFGVPGGVGAWQAYAGVKAHFDAVAAADTASFMIDGQGNLSLSTSAMKNLNNEITTLTNSEDITSKAIEGTESSKHQAIQAMAQLHSVA